MMSAAILREGRSEFTPEERARVELSRYRCYLLGLPEALLGTTPKEIVTLMAASLATLRSGFDDETCGNLLRATIGAYLPADESLPSRIFDRVEKGFLVGHDQDGIQRGIAAVMSPPPSSGAITTERAAKARAAVVCCSGSAMRSSIRPTAATPVWVP